MCMAGKYCTSHLEAQGGLQPIASRKMGPWSYNHKEMHFANGMNWKWIIPQYSLQMRTQSDQHLDFSLVKPRAEDLSKP